jgi:hypothetical protein
MAKPPSVCDVVEDIFQSILATPKQQRKLRSSTFWDKFGFERRTKDRVDQVIEALRQRNIVLNVGLNVGDGAFGDSAFGTESKHEWLVLSHVIPPRPPETIEETRNIPTPSNSWFDLIARRVYESEREVEYYFVVPLLEQLGYEEEDLAVGFPVQMFEGTRRVNKEADFVLFNGANRTIDDVLLIVEAKKTERILTEDAVGQARAYAMWLSTPYYIVSNGDEVRVYLFRGAVQPDVMLMTFKRGDLRQNWGKLYQTVGKQAIIEHKEKLSKMHADSGV